MRASQFQNTVDSSSCTNFFALRFFSSLYKEGCLYSAPPSCFAFVEALALFVHFIRFAPPSLDPWNARLVRSTLPWAHPVSTNFGAGGQFPCWLQFDKKTNRMQLMFRKRKAHQLSLWFGIDSPNFPIQLGQLRAFPVHRSIVQSPEFVNYIAKQWEYTSTPHAGIIPCSK